MVDLNPKIPIITLNVNKYINEKVDLIRLDKGKTELFAV